MVLGGIGTFLRGVSVANDALEPGATVSSQVGVALIAFLAVGAIAGGWCLMILSAAGRRHPPRPSNAPPSVVRPTFDLLAIGVVVGGGVFVSVVDLLVVAPGETVSVSLWAKLTAAGIGFVVVVGLLDSFVDSHARSEWSEAASPSPLRHR